MICTNSFCLCCINKAVKCFGGQILVYVFGCLLSKRFVEARTSSITEAKASCKKTLLLQRELPEKKHISYLIGDATRFRQTPKNSAEN